MAKKNVFEINYASSPKIRDRVEKLILPMIKERRLEREDMEEEWLEYFYMWNVSREQVSGYNGRAKLFIPEVRKNVEAQARQLVKAAFPNEDYVNCIPGPTGTHEGADLQKEVRLYQARRAKLRLQYYLMMRQECLYGTSPGAVYWKNVTRKIFTSVKKKGKIITSPVDREIFNGPMLEVVDLFKWYVLNPYKMDFQEDGCFRDSMVNRFDIEAMEKMGRVYDLKKILDSSGDSLSSGELERYIEKVEASGLLLQRGGSAGEAVRREELDVDSRILKTTVHLNLLLPEGVDKDHEDPNVPVPVVIDIYGNKHIASIMRQEEYFQAAPYVRGLYIMPNADEAYGQGIPKAIKYMQHELNTKAEQAMDSATLALNPLAFIDPALAGNMGSFEVEPGAVWWVNPQGVKLGSIPDVTATGYAAIAQLRSQMADFSDRAPALPTQLMGKARTATQSDAVSNAMSIDLEAFAQQNEELILVPTMDMWTSLTDQNITDDQILVLTGPKYRKAKKVLVQRAKLIGQYAYTWRGSSVGQNKAILTRQLIDFMKIVATLPPQDRMNLNARMDVIAKMIFTEGMDLPGADKIFGSPQMESTDPVTELMLLKKGFEIEVLPGDDDAAHLLAHDAQMKDKELTDDMKEELSLHQARHAQQREYKRKMAEQQKMMMMQMQMMQEQQGNSKGSGNRTQLSPNSNAGNMASGVRA
jgi:hypothetical protein